MFKQHLNKEKQANSKVEIDKIINTDATRISWTRSLKNDADKGTSHKFSDNDLITAAYRPFCRQKLYYNKSLVESPGLSKLFFPNSATKNLLICISGEVRKDFSVLLTSNVSDLEVIGRGQCFPLYYYEKREKESKNLFDESGDSEYVRRDAITDFILGRAKAIYGKTVSKEDIFYYVYGFLHSPEYRTMFANDLKKMLPRLPLVEDVRDFWKFSKSGRALAELHINYETVPAYDGVTVTGADSGFYTVEKMRFPKKDQKDTILFNSKITISNIPAKAYEYVVNGKSAIEWIMERYKVTVDLNAKGEGSGIKNDPNDWATEVSNPRYILDLLLSIINVSVQTVDIVNDLPKVTFEG